MKTKMHFLRGTILMTSVLSAIGAQAQSFSYNGGTGANGDVLVCFRPATGPYDLVVDAGSVSTFTNLAKGSSITINPTYYTGSLLSYVGTNDIFFSALACERISGAKLTNNVWITRPRSNPNVQSTPWPCVSAAQQGNAASQIDSIGNDGVNIADQGTTPFNLTSPTNTATAVVEPEEGNNGAGAYFNSYSFLMGAAGNLGANFWGDSASHSVEQATSDTFTSDGQPVLADFYQLLSSHSGQAATYLGYFKLDTAGVLTYTAGPAVTLIPPTITSITRSGNTTTIQFSSIQGFTYTLLGTNTAGISASRSTWPVIGTSQVGDGGTDTFTDTTSDGSRVYVITAH
jgi:hypothetical protein